MPEASLEHYLEELHRKISSPGVQRTVLLLPLLNGEWEVVAATDSTGKADRSLRGFRFTPSGSFDWTELAEGVLREGDPRSHLYLHFFGVSEEKVLVFYLAPVPFYLFIVLLREDLTGTIREILRKHRFPFSTLERAWVLENRRLVFNRFLFSLVSLLEGIDAYTYHHSLRVAVLAERVAFHLGLSEEAAEKVRIAGLIHDLGKLFIPREILLKPGKLTEEEFAEVKRHVLELDRVFLGNEFMEPYIIPARYHHERLDGSGYLGLREVEIPLESRILAVCDVFDALIHDRPYREAFTLEGTIRELTVLAELGKLDRVIVHALLHEVPEYYLSPLEGEQVPLFPGLEVTVQRVLEGREEVYPGKVGESEGEKTAIIFPPEACPLLVPHEEVLVSYELSYLTIEARSTYLFQKGNRYFFEVGRAMRRRKSFVLPWSLEIRFLRVERERLKEALRVVAENPGRLERARTEAIGGERILFLCKDHLRVGDSVVLLFEAYGERFIIPGRVTQVEDLGFAYRILVEDFAVPEREIDRLYGAIFRREAELRAGFVRYAL